MKTKKTYLAVYIKNGRIISVYTNPDSHMTKSHVLDCVAEGARVNTGITLIPKYRKALSKDKHLKLKDAEGNIYEWNLITATFRA